jgi:polyisoprenoid-binding protein YceI
MILARVLLAAIGATAGLLALPASAQTLLPAKSEIDFSARQMGVPLQGHFSRFGAQLAFDPRQPAAAKIALTVDLASATLGSPEADAELPKPAWFDAAHFPQAKFQSTSVKPGAPGHYDVAGTLTIKGISRPVTVPVTLSGAGAQTLASGSFTIKRLDYRIGDGEWADTSMVANEVQVQFKLALSGVAGR